MAHWRHWLGAAMAMVFGAGCGGGSVLVDAAVEAGREASALDGSVGDSGGPGADAGAIDAGAIDAGTIEAGADGAMRDADAGAMDASEPRDGAADAACDPATRETTMPMGVCDGRGMLACAMWAQTNAGGNPNARAVCITGMTSGCARADQCANASDLSTCRCGGGPACARGEVCVEAGPTARCRPIACP